MIILFPLVLTIAFGASFGAVGGSQSATYTIAIVDTGNNSASHAFAQALASSNILKVKNFQDNHTAQSALSQGQVQGVLLLPESFASSIESFQSYPNDPTMWVNCTLQSVSGPGVDIILAGCPIHSPGDLDECTGRANEHPSDTSGNLQPISDTSDEFYRV